VLGVKRLLAVFAAGALALAVLGVFVPQVGERIERTMQLASTNERDVDTALSGRTRIWSAAVCMYRTHWFNGVGARGFREAFPECDPAHGNLAAWGEGPALHAHQVVLEVASETGTFGLVLWIAGLALGWRAWRYAPPEAREHARPAMLALAATLFPFNTHLAFYSTFWGGLALMLAALYAGSLLARDAEPAESQA
jgi:O-antigen ligase